MVTAKVGYLEEKGEQDAGLQHPLLLLMNVLSQNSNLLLHAHHAIREHGDGSYCLSKLLIKASHWRGW